MRPTPTPERPDLPADGEVVVADAWWDGNRLGPSTFRVINGAVYGPPTPGPADLPTVSPVGPTTMTHGSQTLLRGTIMPGIHDAHVHTMLADVRQMRAAGVASVVDLGGIGFDLQELSAEGLRPGSGMPRVAYAGAYLTVVHGYPSLAPWALPGSCRDVASPDHAAPAVQEQIADGATRIKAVISTVHDAPTFDVPTLTVVAEAAHAAGVELVTHAQGPGAVEIALDAGADVLAHTPWTERLPISLIRRAAATTEWISTIDIHEYGSNSTECRTALHNLRRFVAAGGRVRYGTDYGNGDRRAGVSIGEVDALLAAGLDIDDVLVAMTGGPADLPVTWLPLGLPDTPQGLSACLAIARILSG